MHFQSGMSIQEIGQIIATYVYQHWQRVLKENVEELLAKFEKIGEPTYGIYIKKLMFPIYEALQAAGYKGPILQIGNSLEEWGPWEHRVRVMWSVLTDEQGEAIGTYLLNFHHSHAQFELPERPHIEVTEETEEDAIRNVIRQRYK